MKRILAALGEVPGCWCVKVHGGAYQSAGVPDIIACVGGRFFGIEVKVDGEHPTKLQSLTMARIVAAGGTVGVAYSVEDAMRIIGR